MRITVRVFAQYAEWLATDFFTLEMEGGARVSDVVRSVRSRDPGGHLIPERPMVALNLEHVRDDPSLNDGDEVALLPPLAGG